MKSILFCKKVFKKVLKLSYKRIRGKPAKKPDATLYDTKKKDLETLESLALLNRINLYYFDESGFNLTPNLPYAWSIIGNTLAIPTKRGKNLNVLGFLDINNSKLFSCNTYSRVDTDVAIEVFEQFVKQIKRSTVVVLDNASIHTSKKFKAKFDEWKEKGLTLLKYYGDL